MSFIEELVVNKLRWGVGKKPRIVDYSSAETINPISQIMLYDDFIGADVVIPASGSDESGCIWTKKIVGAAPPTVAIAANTVNGVVACTLTSDSQAQTAILHADDQKVWDSGQGLIFEARIKLSVLPTDVAEIVIGLASDYAAPDSTTYNAMFTADGDGALTCESDDNTTDSGAIASGTTLDNATWAILRIDCSNESDVKFYINGVRVASSTTFVVQGPLQPFIGCYKASGAGVGTIQVDYVRVWQNRSTATSSHIKVGE